jgi:hypothetical protein
VSDMKRPQGWYGRDTRSPLELLLASLPCVSSACAPPANAPLTPEEVEQTAEYLRTRRGPASNGHNRTG